MATIQEVYIALFGRPADPAGLEYYVEATNDGANLDAVGDLSASEEYSDRFDGMNNVQKVQQIYQDLFNRSADAAGLAFYVGLLNSGDATAQDIAIRILDGATDDDAEIIANKVEAANAFTASIDTEVEIGSYMGNTAAQLGREFLDGITSDDATIPTQAQVDQAIADIVDNVGTGTTYNLVVGADAITGTADGDTFVGQLDSADDLDGAGSVDTIEGTIVGGVGPLGVVAPTLENIERLFLTESVDDTVAAFGIDLVNATGVQQVWARDIEVGEAFAVTNGTADITYGVEGIDQVAAGGTGTATYDIGFAADELDGDTDLKLAVNGTNGSIAAFTASGGGAADIEEVSLSAMGESESIVSLAAFTDAEQVNLAGTGDLDVTFNAALEDLDISEFSGELTADFGTNDNDIELDLNDSDNTIDLTDTTGDNTINGGDGADDIRGGDGDSNFSGGDGEDTLVAGSAESVIDGGDGNDILGGGTSSGGSTVDAELTGGEGNDEFHFNVNMSGNTIMDFTAGEDVISLKQGTDGISFTESVDNGLRGTSDLSDDNFNVIGAYSQVDSIDVDGELVVITTAFADQAAIDAAVNTSTDADEFFFVAYNSDAGNAQLYYVSGGAATTADLVADIDGVDLAGVQGLTADNFDIYL